MTQEINSTKKLIRIVKSPLAYNVTNVTSSILFYSKTLVQSVGYGAERWYKVVYNRYYVVLVLSKPVKKFIKSKHRFSV